MTWFSPILSFGRFKRIVRTRERTEVGRDECLEQRELRRLQQRQVQRGRQLQRSDAHQRLFGQGPKGGGNGVGGGLAWWVWGLGGVGIVAVFAASGAVCYLKARPRKDAGGVESYGQSNPVASKSAIA